MHTDRSIFPASALSERAGTLLGVIFKKLKQAQASCLSLPRVPSLKCFISYESLYLIEARKPWCGKG